MYRKQHFLSCFKSLLLVLEHFRERVEIVSFEVVGVLGWQAGRERIGSENELFGNYASSSYAFLENSKPLVLIKDCYLRRDLLKSSPISALVNLGSLTSPTLLSGQQWRKPSIADTNPQLKN